MRAIGRIAWITIFLAIVPPAEAGFRWLGDWQVSQSGSTSFDAGSLGPGPDWVAEFARIDAYGSFSPDGPTFTTSSIGMSRSFEVTDEPGGLPMSVGANWSVNVNSPPHLTWIVSADVTLTPAVNLRFGPVYRDYHEYDGLAFLLGDGIYSLGLSTSISVDFNEDVMYPASSSSSLFVEFYVVPAPPGVLLVALGGTLIGTVWLTTRRGRPPARRPAET